MGVAEKRASSGRHEGDRARCKVSFRDGTVHSFAHNDFTESEGVGTVGGYPMGGLIETLLPTRPGLASLEDAVPISGGDKVPINGPKELTEFSETDRNKVY
jgi:hypothetical protein